MKAARRVPGGAFAFHPLCGWKPQPLLGASRGFKGSIILKRFGRKKAQRTQKGRGTCDTGSFEEAGRRGRVVCCLLSEGRSSGRWAADFRHRFRTSFAQRPEAAATSGSSAEVQRLRIGGDGVECRASTGETGQSARFIRGRDEVPRSNSLARILLLVKWISPLEDWVYWRRRPNFGALFTCFRTMIRTCEPDSRKRMT